MKLLSVLIEYKLSSLDTPFTYVCDDDCKVEVGCRVYVPFGHQNIVGYIIDIKHVDESLEELSKPEVYSDGAKSKAIQEEIEKTEKLIEETSQKWEEVSALL